MKSSYKAERQHTLELITVYPHRIPITGLYTPHPVQDKHRTLAACDGGTSVTSGLWILNLVALSESRLSFEMLGTKNGVVTVGEM